MELDFSALTISPDVTVIRSSRLEFVLITGELVTVNSDDCRRVLGSIESLHQAVELVHKEADITEARVINIMAPPDVILELQRLVKRTFVAA